MLQSSVTEQQSNTNRQPLQKGISTFKPPPSIQLELDQQSKRRGPQNLSHRDSISLQTEPYRLKTVSAVQIELAYMSVKFIDAERCTIPSCTGFHTLLQGDDVFQKSALYYLPVIEASDVNCKNDSEVKCSNC